MDGKTSTSRKITKAKSSCSISGHLVRSLHGRSASLAAAYKEFHPKGVEILGISLDQPTPPKK